MAHTWPVSIPLEDYALLGDRRTAALVSREGSIDWLCLPRFDSGAVFARLLGDEDDGSWSMSIEDGEVIERSYAGDTFVLRTRWRGPDGEAVVTEFMPQSDHHSDLMRRVEVTRGRVVVRHELRMRPDYGARLPWMRQVDVDGAQTLVGISGPDGFAMHGPSLRAEGTAHTGRFRLTEGEAQTWSLVWFPSHEDPPAMRDWDEELASTVEDWTKWASELSGHDGDPAIIRSLLVLRALTHHATGGIVAAPTTSLPEDLGGERNWDYRYVWLRDSALVIEAMLAYGPGETMWRDWLLRAVAGDAQQVRIVYGIAGEIVPPDRELEHLSGYADSRPVRTGNSASEQYQADVIGEVMIALDRMRESGVEETTFSWSLQRLLLDYVEQHFDDKDCGIWEMRGERHHFTHGRVMMWAAFDCGIRAVETRGLSGPVERWRGLRERLHDEIHERGWNAEIDSFTQTYGSAEVDASLLVLPHTGFIAWDDPRMLATVRRIEADLVDEQGLVYRYRCTTGVDGLEGTEYPFLLCCFWLVESYARTGRLADAERLYDQVVSYGGELHLLAEEYDPERRQLMGNYPQAFSHLGLVEAAEAIREARKAG